MIYKSAVNELFLKFVLILEIKLYRIMALTIFIVVHTYGNISMLFSFTEHTHACVSTYKYNKTINY